LFNNGLIMLNIECRGINTNGQLGVQDNKTRFTPTRVHFPINVKHTVESVTCGSTHCLALVKDDETSLKSLYTW
jgi:alpha-tubulin suppressor-like RCC1 family protein